MFIACLHADYHQLDWLYDDWKIGIWQAYGDDWVIVGGVPMLIGGASGIESHS